VHIRSLRRAAVASLAVGLTLAVAGCGDQNAGPGYANGSSGGVTYADQALTKDEIMRATYDAAVKAGTAHMTMKMSGQAKLTARGDVDYGHGQPRMAMTMSMPQLSKGRMEMRYVGKMIYMQLPGLTPPGKFVAIDPNDKTSPLSKSFGSTTDQMDPLKSIKAMESAVQSADRVGKQTMAGVTVEHYKLTVATASLVKGLSPEAAQQAKLPKTITYDLWLDERHLLRRMSFDLANTQFDSTMSRWGKPVRVQRPSAAQIATVPGA
jgi:LppX_LprAFG lipoprotein